MILMGRKHIDLYIQRSPAAGATLVLWLGIAREASWRNQDDVLTSFPATKFLTPNIAYFYSMTAGCVVSAQIAFNTGTLIVLAVTEVESSQTQGS